MRTWWIDREDNIAYEPGTDGVDDYTEVVELTAYKELEERFRIEHEHNLNSQDIITTQILQIGELEKSECRPLDVYYKTCEVMNGQLEARIKELELEIATQKVLDDHAPLFQDLRVSEMQDKIDALEAKLKSVLPCFCKQIK